MTPQDRAIVPRGRFVKPMTSRRLLKWLGGLLVLTIATAVCGVGYVLWSELRKMQSEDPLVWESVIQAFEAEQANSPEPENAVVFVGSSSIRFWRSLEEDMQPLSVIQRGFGGAKLADVVFYADRLITVHEPSAVVVFAGTNDISEEAPKTPESLLASYRHLVTSVRKELPGTPIYYLAITPSPARQAVWPIARRTNRLIEEFSREDESLRFIATSSEFLDDHGLPDDAYFWYDGLHLNQRGYRLWAHIIRTRLLADLEGAFIERP